LLAFFSNAHVNTYSPNSISNILQICGFEIVSITHGGYCKNMRVIAKKAKTNNPIEHSLHTSLLKDSFQNHIDFLLNYDTAYTIWTNYMQNKISYTQAKIDTENALPNYTPIHFYEGGKLFTQGDYISAKKLLKKCLLSDFNEENLALQIGAVHAAIAACNFRMNL